MRLIKARILGFQSFSDSGDLDFSEGINLVIGQNNAGKSALLRALLPALPDDRHRTPQKWETFRLRLPKIDLTIGASGAEIRDWILRSDSTQHIQVAQPQAQDVIVFMKEFFKHPHQSISVSRTANSTFTSKYPSHRLFEYVTGTQACAVVMPNDGELTIQPQFDGSDTLPDLLWHAWSRDMFYFTAERMTIGEAPPATPFACSPTQAICRMYSIR